MKDYQQIELMSDFLNKHDPFHNYFNNLPTWDPKKDNDYIGEFSSFIETKNNARFKDMLTKWLIRTIRCAIEPKFFNKHALVLVGKTQNSGKSTWCRYLCPQKLSEFIAENIGVDKDSQISMSQNLIINLDELSSLHKSDLQSLKSLFSLETIKCRRPYDRSATRAPRTASFVGSTDRPEFLSDDAGSVRWICIEIDNISWDYNKIPIDKVWAQAFSLYKKGETGNLTKSEIEESEEVNRKFKHKKTMKNYNETKLSMSELKKIMQLANEAAEGLEEEGDHYYTILLDDDYTLIADDISETLAKEYPCVVVSYAVKNGRARLVGTTFHIL